MTKVPRARAAKKPPGPPRPLAIVGVGASAGGIEALSRLFTSLKPDLGFAYVAILHLAPDHTSSLAEILQRCTRMAVAPAVDGTLVLPDRVYVIAPGQELSLEKGRLRVTPRDPSPTRTLAVDGFLRSLAADQGRRAFAVILSGSGNDGALGIKAVKNEGGLVLVQDLESAAHHGMPQSAADTGAADFTLPPEGIAEELQRFSRHPYLLHGPRLAPALPKDDLSLHRIFALVREETGIDFSLYKPTTVGRRLLRRLIMHKFDRLDQYLELLRKDPREVRAFVEETLIHVTHFFRETESFKALQKRVLPRLLKSGGKDSPIRVWVPGCSTGEEAYSLAICLLDALGKQSARRPIQIFATDVSEDAVGRARVGFYPEGIRRDVPAALLRRFFTKVSGGYQVAKVVRDCCIFAQQNLAKDPPFANLDLVSCRNVLIYLEPALQRRILPIFHYALKPTGALMLGSAETIGDFGNLFSVADGRAHLYNKNPTAAPRFDLGAPAAHKEIPMTSKPKTVGWPDSDVQKTADRLLLTRFAPAGVIINSDMEILHFRGAINKYLQPAAGRASLNLLKMLPDECHAMLHALLERAKKSNETASQPGIVLETAGEGRQKVSVEITPVKGPVSGERCFIVLFVPAAPAARQGKGKPVKPAREDKGSALLRKELNSTKEYLRAIIEDHEAANEELKAANEEIISSNEELQSTNEELETAKEELQAANEELTTLNEELQVRNGDLTAVNNDLINLLASVHLPIVMLDGGLRVRRFTPMAQKVMNLIPGDVGRPIGDLKLRIEMPDLEELVVEVIDTVSTREVEVRDKDGRWYSLRIRPYKTTENKIDGAVLILIDIDVVKKAILDLSGNTQVAEAVLDMVREGLVVLDLSFKISAANSAFQRACDGAKTVVGRSLFEAAGGRWNIPALRQGLAKLAAEGEPFAGLEVDAGGERLLCSARRLTEAGKPSALLLSVVFSARA